MNVIPSHANFIKSKYRIDEIKKRGIDRISEKISYDHFVENYLKPNIPCIFDQSFTKHWQSVMTWVEDDGDINWPVLESLFKDSEVPVVDCNNEYYGYNSVSPIIMKFSDFTTNMKNKNSQLYYLKDWHCAKQFPDYNFYEVPIYFQSDWLNEFWEGKEDDYKFVYIGPKESWTPLHADVLRSHSWSANICGKKRWVIYFPDEKDEKFEVVQNAGEIIFIPSGWFHEVYNEEDTISINHNWINAYNVGTSWKFLKSRLADVQKEIEELKYEPDYDLQCQKILRADSGMDYIDFFNFLHFISSKRIKELNEKELLEFEQHSPKPKSETHLINYKDHIHTIQTIEEIINDMLINCDIFSLYSLPECNFNTDPKAYQNLLKEFYKKYKNFFLSFNNNRSELLRGDE